MSDEAETPPTPAWVVAGSPLRMFGILLLVLSVVSFLFGWKIDTAVEPVFGQAVNNLGLLQKQALIIQSSIGGFIAGAVLYAAGAIVQQVARGKL